MSLLCFYRDHTEKVLLPFWLQALDHERGGVYTCFDNTGNTLLSTDKYTWSQGRFVWLLARAAHLIEKGLLEGNSSFYLDHARRTVEFLRLHVFLDNGNCAYVLSEDGQKKEAVIGQGYDSSFYADCFVVLGFAEYSRVTGDEQTLQDSLVLGLRIIERIAEADLRSEPYPIPEGYEAHSVSMILLNVFQELADALESFHNPQAETIRNHARLAMNKVLEEFLDKTGLIREMLPVNKLDSDTLLSRHIAPGHSMECMWFVIVEALRQGRHDRVEMATKAVERVFEIGWDQEYGGLLRYVDRDGGSPRGRRIGGRYENLICDTWDMKIWWPHSEALYSLLLSYRLTGREELYAKFEQMHDYVFQTFPNSDKSVGEWIQIRNRQGEPVQKTVALPVKDPYHILRNMFLIIELLGTE